MGLEVVAATAITMEHFRRNAAEYLSRAVQAQDVISVTTKNGTAVIISEEEFRSMQETIMLMKSEGMRESVEEARSTPIEESDDFVW